MEGKYIFDKGRKGVSEKNQIAIQGFCSEEFLDNFDVNVSLVEEGKSTRIPCETIISNIPVIKKIDIQDPSVCRMLTVLVSFGSELSDGARLVVNVIRGDKETEIYTCNGKHLKQILNTPNGNIDAAYTKGDQLMISGWIADNSKLCFEVHKGSATGQLVDVQVERTSRSDVSSDYPEYKGDSNLGFLVTVPKCSEKLYLVVKGEGLLYTERVRFVEGGGKISPVAKVNRYAGKVMKSLKEKGVKATVVKVKNRLFHSNDKPKEYNKWYQEHKTTEEELERQRKESFEYEPTLSVLVPLYETDEKYLRELIDSVKAQTYSKWQLCFSDGSKDSGRLKDMVGSYSRDDERIQYVAIKQGPLGISENTNQALTIAKGEYIVLGDHDDLFASDAFYECVKALNIKKYDVIYTDEDKIDGKGKGHFEPNFKPDFNIDLLRSNNYICHMFVASKTLIDKVGMFDDSFDGAQDYDFILRCVESAESICHIPKILYHWRSHRASTASSPEAKLYAFEAGKKALEAHYKRLGIKADVESIEDYGFYKTNYHIMGNPKVSIVIPNKDHIDDLKKCMDSIDRLSDFRNYEFVIVENNSTQQETFDYYKEIEARENVKVLYWDKEFNYSAINNFGVKAAEGEYVLLLNNDTEIINNDCITQLLSYCQRDEVGIVGARLYYQDGSIQHAGVVVGFGGIAGHAFVGLYEEDGLYMSRTKVACDYSAVTAACMMVKKDIFHQVGGLDETFKVAFNDIDFCMKVRELGKLVVYNPNAKLYHYESKSRGLEDTPEKQERFLGEIDRFIDKWPEILKNGDPYYNVNLALDRADFAVKG